jgi:hypothetical protein
MIGKWRYGIVNFRLRDHPEHRFFGIGELYYKDDPNKIYYCSDPVNPFIEADEENSPQESLLVQLNRMINDITNFPQPFDEDGPFEKEPDHHAEDWVDEFGTDEEPFAGHLGFIPDDLDEEELDEYIKSIQEEG